MDDEQGYRTTTKVLHWLTVWLLVGQLVVGYLLDVDDDERLLDVALSGDDRLLTLHVLLGVSILLVAVLRLLWRRTTQLPPWAECLSETERRVAHWTERVLYASLLVMPSTGLLLLAGDDDLLTLHVASHIVLYAAVAVHLGLVLRHTVRRRDGLLSRML